jgi:hypothetical protein
MSLLFVAMAFIAGCASPSSQVDISHVHGLAYDPASSALYVATHHGLVQGIREGDWSWRYVGENRYDLMGFSQDGETANVFYAGGHPGLLGLAASTDGGVTWDSRSYFGKADIHALTGIPGRGGHIVAWWAGQPLKASADGGYTWENLTAMPAGVHGVAASEDVVFVATPRGLLASRDGGRTLESVSKEELVKVASSRDGSVLLGARPSGDRAVEAVRSLDAGRSWTPVNDAGLRGVAFEISFASDPEDGGHWFAATSAGAIMESIDGGVSWTTLRNA